MNKIAEKLKPYHLVYVLVVGGLFFAALNFSGQFNPFAALNFNQPLFSSPDQFVLAAEKKIELAENIQISSGDLAANEEIRIRNNNIINGNLFSDRIIIASGTQINGNISFNRLDLEPKANILGATSSPISLPIIKFPQIPDFPVGSQKLSITQDQTIVPGNFNEIEVKENIALTLTLGIYNLNKLELRENSKLLFSGKTTINIKQDLEIKEKVLIAQTTNIPSTNLQINVQEDKDIQIDKDSLISAKLLAPNSQVNLGERITFRGQIIAKEIKVGEDSVLSRQDFFSKESDPTKIVEDQGVKFIVNEILILFKDETTQLDAQKVADLVAGRIIGFIPTPKIFKLEITTQTVEELNNKIQAIKNSNPLIVEVVQNLVSQ